MSANKIDMYTAARNIVNGYLNNYILNACMQIGNLSKFFMLKSGIDGCDQYEFIHSYMKCSPKHVCRLSLNLSHFLT